MKATNNSKLELSDAIDRGLATLGWNAKPEGWRTVYFEELRAYVTPDCPQLNGALGVELFPDEIDTYC